MQISLRGVSVEKLAVDVAVELAANELDEEEVKNGDTLSPAPTPALEAITRLGTVVDAV